MSKTVKKAAKTVKEAIQLALAELKLTEDDVQELLNMINQPNQ